MKTNMNYEISIIVPVYNEEKTIKKILYKINKVKLKKKEIIVINDGSNDNTYKILLKLRKQNINKLISLKKNYGKGYAIRQGLKQANGKIIIIQDGDLEYNPQDYFRLIKPIISNRTNVVYGSRVLNKNKRKVSKSFTNNVRILANYFLTKLSNIINGQNLTDAHTCYKVFKKSLYKKISLKENGFSFCPELTTKLSNINEKIIEVPISYNGRDYKEGKKIKFSDGIKAILTIFKYKFLN